MVLRGGISRILLGAAAALVCSCRAAAAPMSPRDVGGTYRLHGTAHIAASPLPRRTVELHADAVLTPGPAPRRVRAHLAAEGYACDLVASLSDDGALVFEDGQRCAVVIQSPDARGHLEARVRSGRGQLRGDHLELDLSCELTGAVRLGGTMLGADVPGTWVPEVPVRGNARAAAEGDRDRSRAAR